MKHLKILHKARLSDELFDDDRPVSAQSDSEGEAEWSEESAVEAVSGFAVAERLALARDDENPFAASPLASAAIQPYGQRRWSEVLADLTGDPGLETCRALGICPVDARTSSSQVVVAVARWMAQFSPTTPLLVETRLRSPRLAGLFGVPNRGVAEVLLGASAADRLTVPVDDGRLHLLPAGEVRGSRAIKQTLAGYPALHASLAERYGSVLVNLPAADSADFARLPVGEMCGAVVLVVDSRAARSRKVEAASRRVRETRSKLAAVLLNVSQTVDSETRRGLQTRWGAVRV